MQTLAPHELKFLELMRDEFLTDNPQIYDVGANEGQFAVTCKQLWPACHVTCFEPGEGAFMKLARNTRPWQDSVNLWKCALGEDRDLVPLYRGEGPDQTASLYKRWLPEIGYLHPAYQMVDVRRLGEFMDGPPVDLLKIDAEGAELAVLKGARVHLHRERVKRIYFEINSCALDSRIFLRDFWRLLVEDRGYHLWQVTSGGDLEPIEDYEPELEDFAAHREFFAE